MEFKILLVMILLLLAMPFSSAAHFIVGQVNDAFDGTSADGRTIVLWNSANGINDNLTDTIGAGGNSGTANTYMIDCELLNIPCDIGDNISVVVFDDGNGYATYNGSVIVTGAGFDIIPALRLNSPPIVTSVLIEDDLSFPVGEVDLTVAGTKTVTCQGTILDYDGDFEISNVTSEFFDSSTSFLGDADDNNQHYTNSSCFLNQTYGNSNQSSFICSYGIEYYANAGSWNCSVSTQDNFSSTIGSNISLINELLAVGLPDIIDFELVDGGSVSNETQVNVTNYGNVMINLSLTGYGGIPGDGWAMNCSQGNNISVYYEKYNLTNSNPGSLTLSQFENLYQNLSEITQIREFNLNYKQNDGGGIVEHTNSTYWRIYVPLSAAGSCAGNIIFGASRSSE